MQLRKATVERSLTVVVKEEKDPRRCIGGSRTSVYKCVCVCVRARGVCMCVGCVIVYVHAITRAGKPWRLWGN